MRHSNGLIDVWESNALRTGEFLFALILSVVESLPEIQEIHMFSTICAVWFLPFIETV